MNWATLKQKIVFLVFLIGAALIMIFQRGFTTSPIKHPSGPSPSQSQNSNIKAVSTSPNPLDNSTILPAQTISVTFNTPIENSGEFKYKMDPPAGVNIKLSDDRKTVEITPSQPFKLGSGYTLFVDSGTKFDSGKRLPNTLIYHFKTISYSGV